ncbi:matrixin family metalloprotease [Gemmatimonas sp.]|uniref:matrixin family metalloprotease n=1 Tax=Gemmatimonas sp. TaxID=1962908 RepID=UPI00398395E1
MKTAETLLACCVVGLACFIGGQSVGVRTLSTRSEAAGAIDERGPRPPRGLRIAVDSGLIVPRALPHREEVLVASSLLVRPARPSISADEIRRRLAPGIGGTYMNALLRSRDSTLTRWPDRMTRPLRVFIRDGDAIEGWKPDYLPVVRDAFATWVQAGIPVRFTFVIDSASADVHVRFTSSFANGISGKTIWSRDAAYWLVSSDIQLAVSHPGGGFVTPPQMRAIALHEVGHLLGLDHAESSDDIMSARVRVRELSETDRATVRLLYAVPAGSLK